MAAILILSIPNTCLWFQVRRLPIPVEPIGPSAAGLGRMTERVSDETNRPNLKHPHQTAHPGLDPVGCGEFLLPGGGEPGAAQGDRLGAAAFGRSGSTRGDSLGSGGRSAIRPGKGGAGGRGFKKRRRSRLGRNPGCAGRPLFGGSGYQPGDAGQSRARPGGGGIGRGRLADVPGQSAQPGWGHGRPSGGQPQCSVGA